jgi:L,D-peptidoglycan transpeptidase YkuD (ErfK/YbiS/YcfS/YnhG family)
LKNAEDLIVRADGVAIWHGRALFCAIGRAGVVAEKREGDLATPLGRWPMRKVFYRPDRLGRFAVALPCRALRENDGWCDDPHDPAYNRLVPLPYAAHCERLWREDGVYDLLVPLGYNDDPVRPGRGSAIFLHLARRDFAPTAGCVALARADLLLVLSEARPGSAVLIG